MSELKKLLEDYRFNFFSESYSERKTKNEKDLECVEFKEMKLKNRRFYGLYLQDMPSKDDSIVLIRQKDQKVIKLVENTYPKEPGLNEAVIDFKFNSGSIWLNSANYGLKYDISFNTIGSCAGVNNEEKHIKYYLNPAVNDLDKKIDDEIKKLKTTYEKRVGDLETKHKTEIANLTYSIGQNSNHIQRLFELTKGMKLTGVCSISSQRTLTKSYDLNSSISYSNDTLSQSLMAGHSDILYIGKGTKSTRTTVWVEGEDRGQGNSGTQGKYETKFVTSDLYEVNQSGNFAVKYTSGDGDTIDWKEIQIYQRG